MIKGIKKILFIIPPYFNINEYHSSNQVKLREPVFTVPYGVLSIATYAKKYSKYSVEIEILDLNVCGYKICSMNGNFNIEATKLIEEKMLGFKPDVVAISALFNTCYNYLGFISNSIKKVKKNTFIMTGGGLPTNLYKEILQEFPCIDATCYGEGEIPILELLDAEDMYEYCKSSVAWITRENLEEKNTPQSIFVYNLDDIPFLDYSLIDLNLYNNGRSIDKRYNQNSKELSIHTSRGCPFNCVFCSNGKIHGKKVRYMSVEKVISEVEQMINLYNIDVLLIEDDHFLSDKERAKEILRRLSKYKLRIEFPNGMAVYAIDDEIGKLLKEAGATTVSLAVESGSDFVLKNIINKPLKSSMIKGAVDILRKNGICVHAFIIIGFPGELEKHREETMQMIFNVGFDWIHFFIAIPIAGSRLYDICKEKGYLIKDDFSDYITTRCNIKTPEIDPEYIEEKIYLMNLEANFVRNYNLFVRDYKNALLFFEDVVQRYPDHALAHYYLVKTYEGLGEKDKIIDYHKEKFRKLVNTNSTWKRYAQYFNLSV